MSCSKFESSFCDKNVERLIETIERAVFSGDELMQQVKKLKQKFQVWEEYVAQLCVQVTALADEIDSDHRKANIAKLSGSVAGTAAAPVAAGAGIALGVGFVLAPATAGLAIPISAVVAALFGGVAGLGALTAGGAIIVDETLRYRNRKKALELLEGEKELRDHITECMQEIQRASKKFEESINLVRRMSSSGLEYSNSLKSIEETKSFLHSVMDWMSNETDKKKIAELCKALWKMVSKLEGIQCLLAILSSPVVGFGAVGTVFAIASAPLHVINLIITSIDIHKGSKTELAAKLRERVKLLEKDRTEISEAVQSHYRVNE